MSLGEIARKVRPKDANVTSQRVFSDDDVNHGDPNRQQETDTPTVPRRSTAVDNAERTLNEIASKTSDELGFQCFGRRQSWSDQDLWEQNLYSANQTLVDATKIWISMMRSGAVVGAARDKALVDMEVAQTAYNETRESCIVAVHAWDKLEAWKAEHAGEWHLPSKVEMAPPPGSVVQGVIQPNQHSL